MSWEFKSNWRSLTSKCGGERSSLNLSKSNLWPDFGFKVCFEISRPSIVVIKQVFYSYYKIVQRDLFKSSTPCSECLFIEVTFRFYCGNSGCQIDRWLFSFLVILFQLINPIQLSTLFMTVKSNCNDSRLSIPLLFLYTAKSVLKGICM